MEATRSRTSFARFSTVLLGGLAGLLTGVSQLTACQNVYPLVEEDRTSNIAHVRASALEVKTENGAITVRATEQPEVTIKAKVSAQTKERLTATRVLAERRDDNTLAVYAEWPDGKRLSNEKCDLEITVPDVSGIKATSSNGAIELKGLSGKAVAKSSNGAVSITDHNGDVQARTSNGAVKIERATGAVDVDTSNGRITVSLKAGAKKTVALESSNGAIELSLPPEFTGAFSVSTANGTITIPQGDGVKIETKSRTKSKFEIGSGGPSCSAKTSNGSITISR